MTVQLLITDAAAAAAALSEGTTVCRHTLDNYRERCCCEHVNICSWWGGHYSRASLVRKDWRTRVESKQKQKNIHHGEKTQISLKRTKNIFFGFCIYEYSNNFSWGTYYTYLSTTMCFIFVLSMLKSNYSGCFFSPDFQVFKGQQTASLQKAEHADWSGDDALWLAIWKRWNIMQITQERPN